MDFPELGELLGQPIYSLSKNEKDPRFLRAMAEVSQFHYEHCEPYQRLCDAREFRPKDLTTLAEIPYLPTSFFKRRLLVSVPDEKVVREVRSSATTSGTSSRMGLDRETSRRQTKCFTKTIVERIGNDRRRFVVVDEPGTIERSAVVTARSSTIKSLLFMASTAEAVLRSDGDSLSLDEERFHAVLDEASRNDEPVIVFGFTYVLYAFVVRRLLAEGRAYKLPDGSNIIHIGGWKKLEAEKVSPEQLVADCAKVFGVSTGKVVDIYGFTEQAGLIYPTCEDGVRHCPVWAEVIVRDPVTLEALPAGKTGVLEFLTPIQTSYPGHSVLTEDVGHIVGVDDCGCGRKGTMFKLVGRASNAEVRGCGVIMAERFA